MADAFVEVLFVLVDVRVLVVLFTTLVDLDFVLEEEVLLEEPHDTTKTARESNSSLRII